MRSRHHRARPGLAESLPAASWSKTGSALALTTSRLSGRSTGGGARSTSAPKAGYRCIPAEHGYLTLSPAHDGSTPTKCPACPPGPSMAVTPTTSRGLAKRPDPTCP